MIILLVFGDESLCLGGLSMVKSLDVVATSLGATVYDDPPCSPSSWRAAGFLPYRFAFPTSFYADLDVEHAIFGFQVLIFYFVSFYTSFVATTAAVWGTGSVP